MFSKLIFGYGKLIMRIYFAQIVIHIKIDFDFFIPSRVRIDHSVPSFSDFRKDCDTSTNYCRPEAYPVLSDFFFQIIPLLAQAHTKSEG